MGSYGQYDDFFTWGVPVGSRRFRSIYLTKTLITIASYGFLWPIPWLFYMRGSCGFPWVPMGSRRFQSIYLTKKTNTIASYGFLWPICYMRGTRRFGLIYLTKKITIASYGFLRMIRWHFYIGVHVGFDRFWSMHLTKKLITIASYWFLWPLQWLFYIGGSHGLL